MTKLEETLSRIDAMSPEEREAASKVVGDKALALANVAVAQNPGPNQTRRFAEGCADLTMALGLLCLKAGIDPRQYLSFCVMTQSTPRKDDPGVADLLGRIEWAPAAPAIEVVER